MRLWGYYAFHSALNSLKKMFRSKVFVIICGIILIGGIFGFTAGLVANVIFSDESSVEAELDEEGWGEEAELDEEGWGEEAEDETEEAWDEETVRIIKVGVEAGAGFLFILFMLVGMYNGVKKGSDIFLMADVNFLFTAPLKPQSVLLFRLCFQMAAAIVGSVYFLFQVPNLVINLNLSIYAVFIIFFAWVFFILLQRLMSVFVYALTATHVHLRKYVLPVIGGIVLLLVLGIGAVYLFHGKGVVATITFLGASKGSRMIPMVGWYKAMIMTAIEGDVGLSLVYMFLLLVGMALMVWGIWKIKADFYEDALSGAQTRDELAHNLREGIRTSGDHTGKKDRSKKIVRNTEMKGWGAGVFFAKEVYNRRRFAFFGLVTKTMLVYLVTGVMVAGFCNKVLENSDFTVIGILLAAILFFRNYGNPIAQETSMNWLFLVPDSPYRKVFYIMASGTYACALDMLPAMVIVAVLDCTSPLMVLLWFVTLLAMDFMLSAVGVMLEAIFPATALDMVKTMLQMVLKFVVLFLIVLMLLAGYLIGGIAVGLLFVLLLSAALGTVSFFIYPSFLHGGIS